MIHSCGLALNWNVMQRRLEEIDQDKGEELGFREETELMDLGLKEGEVLARDIFIHQ